jgi:phospholipase/carboxylesterase
VPEAAQPSGLLVFFHGAGGTAASGLALVKDIAASRGLLVLLPSSSRRTWDLVTGAVGPDVEMLNDRLADVLSGYDPVRIALAGFSDGATYALAVGLANGDLVDAVLAFSPGHLAPPVRVGRPHIWVSHGTADTVLPVDRCGRKVLSQLRADGYEVDYLEFDGGHVITPELLATAISTSFAT